MSEPRPTYGANTAVLSAFPESARPALHLAQKKPSGDESQILLHCILSAMQPDYVCNIALMAELPIEYRNAALSIITQALTIGFESQERMAILAYAENIMQSQNSFRPRR